MIDDSIETFFESLRKILLRDILVVGIGNSLKADDGIGSQICSQLHTLIPDNVIDAGTTPENYIQVIIHKAPKVILFIDAIDFTSPAGTIRVFEADDLSAAGISTHALSPRLLTDLIAQNTGAKIYFIGIQPKSMMMGHAMSTEVILAQKKLEKMLKRFISLNEITG